MTMGACPSSGLATAAAARGSSLASAAAAARRLTGVRGLSKASAVSPLLSPTGLPQKKKHLQLQRCWPAQRHGDQRLATTAAAQTTSEALTNSAPASALEEFFRSTVRPDFDILKQEVHGMPLVYLDSAATSQKPRQVIDAMDDYYRRYNANVHRGVHTLSSLATEEYERAREKVAAFVNAAQREEIVFTRNASEAINLVAYAWGAANLQPGDEVVLTVAEHHSNLVPWQMIAQRTGAVLRHAGLKALEGGGEEVDVDQLLNLISPKTKMVSVHHISNTLGSSLPIERIVAHTREVTDGNARVLVDACQSVPHMAVDVQALGVDFAVASSHKMLGPTGIGFLYGRYDLLSSMPPFLGGGEMIADVFLDYSTYAEPPSRLEAGTPAIAEAVGLGAAIDYLNEIGMDAVHNYEMELATYMYSKLREVPHVRIFGPPPPSLLKNNNGSSSSSSSSIGRAAALCAFNVDCVHPTDLSTFLDQQHGIAIRSGHHCTQPLHRELGISSSARASLHVYNTRAEVDAFVAALRDTIDFFCSVPS